MLKHFKCKQTELIWQGKVSKRLPRNIQSIARRKLRILNQSKTLNDLRVLPNNRLERLKGNRKGQYSIRINKQWRLYFRFESGDCEAVEIVDYHK